MDPTTTAVEAAGDPWTIFNTVIVIIVVCCVAGIAVLILLICIGTKRRLMAVRSRFVPVLNQGLSNRQKKYIVDEHTRETTFEMTPPSGGVNSNIFGWFDGADNGMGKELQRQVREFWAMTETAERELKTPLAAARVNPACDSRMHPHEKHLGTLVYRTARVVEQHALALGPGLAREPGQDVGTYVRHLQTTLHLDRRTCERYTAAVSRARWAGPLRSTLTLPDWLHFSLLVRELIAQIDSANY